MNNASLSVNFFVLQLASGLAFFEGIAVVICCLLLLMFIGNRWGRAALRIGILLGTGLVAASATPLQSWNYIIGFLLVAVFLILSKGADSRSGKLRRVTTAALLLFLGFLIFQEASWWRSPKISVPNGSTIYVIGDSVSAGLKPGEKTWPLVLKETAGHDVVNLAQPGAVLMGGLKQADRIPSGDSVVILEIGGNDLLGGISSDDFGQKLQTLISKLQNAGHKVAMFELPLLPFYNRFGEIQREAAKKNHIALIPKRCLSRVFGMKNGTSDGLHLTPAGHEALGNAIGKMLVSEPSF